MTDAPPFGSVIVLTPFEGAPSPVIVHGAKKVC